MYINIKGERINFARVCYYKRTRGSHNMLEIWFDDAEDGIPYQILFDNSDELDKCLDKLDAVLVMPINIDD